MPSLGLSSLRAKPQLEILSGVAPTVTSTGNPLRQLPVASGVTILSGEVMSPSWNAGLQRYEWVLGGTAGEPAYLAVTDSTAQDVIEADKLSGAPLSGNFEVQTPYYKAADAANFIEKAPITIDGNTGDIKLAASGDYIYGFVSGGWRGAAAGYGAQSAQDGLVVQFTTKFTGARVA
jgi:hypothetical protein